MADINTEIKNKDGETLSLINFIDHTIKEIKYGKLELTIHDSKVVQIEKTDKFRFL